MVCTYCYEKSLRWQLQDYVCSECNTLFIAKPTKRFCEFCLYKTLPFPLNELNCSGCGKEYPSIVNVIEEKRSDSFWGDEE
jgi:hypothetical protein